MQQTHGMVAAARARQWTQHPSVRFLLVVGMLFGLYAGYGYLTGPSRLTAHLQQRLAEHPAALNVLVTTRFPPEEFHIRIFQQVGSMRGIEGRTASLHAVTPSHVRYLSRYYWVQQIDLAPGTQ